jgi:hypothetical protein
MSISQRLSELPDEIASDDVVELRKALIRIQKQLKDANALTN